MADESPASTSATASSPPRPAASSDETALAQKKRDLDQAKADAAAANTKAASLSTEIKVLEARVGEVKQANDAYASATPKLNADIAQSNSEIATKLSMASAAVKPKQGAIEAVIKNYDDDLASQSGKLQQIRQASEAQGDFAAMYFLLNEASTLLKGISVDSPQAYATKLAAAQAELQTAKADSTAKMAEVDKQTASEDDATTQLNAATAARRVAILAQLKKIPTSIADAA